MKKAVSNYMGFDKLFWGYLFFFSIRIQGIDLLPVTIGYLLFYFGLRQLDSANQYFDLARKFTLPLIFLSTITFYEFPHHMDLANVFGIVLSIFNLVIVYLICRGVEEMANQNDFSLLSKASKSRWIFYFVVQVLILFSLLIQLVNEDAIGILSVLTVLSFVLSVISIVLLMALMRQCKQSFS